MVAKVKVISGKANNRVDSSNGKRASSVVVEVVVVTAAGGPGSW